MLMQAGLDPSSHRLTHETRRKREFKRLENAASATLGVEIKKEDKRWGKPIVFEPGVSV